MRSLKLVSASTRDSTKLTKRKPRVRQIQESDTRFLWAAYQMGGWSDLFAQNLSKEAFAEKMVEILGAVDLDWIIEIEGENGLRPIGIVLGVFRAAGRAVEPHVDWFPWATPRNKMEGAAQFLHDVGKTYKVFLYIESENALFWDRIWKYRILKKGCKINDYFAPGECAEFYYTPGPF